MPTFHVCFLLMCLALLKGDFLHEEMEFAMHPLQHTLPLYLCENMLYLIQLELLTSEGEQSHILQFSIAETHILVYNIALFQ